MTVLLIILAVLLGLAVLAVLLGLALLWVRAGVEAVGVDGEISVELRYGFVRVPVWPRPRPSPGTSWPGAGTSWTSASSPRWRSPCWGRWRGGFASAGCACAC